MAGKMLNFKVSCPFKLPHGLTGNFHAFCHYSYNLPLASIKIEITDTMKMEFNGHGLHNSYENTVGD